MSFVRNQPAKAIEYSKKAVDSQHQYINLKLISYWEMALANLALWDLPQSLECWVTLKAKGAVSRFLSQTNSWLISPQWFKATYAYGVAVCTLDLYGEKKGEISTILEEVPRSRRKIGGMLMPQEVSLLLQAAIPVLTRVYLRNMPRGELRSSRNRADVCVWLYWNLPTYLVQSRTRRGTWSPIRCSLKRKRN